MPQEAAAAAAAKAAGSSQCNGSSAYVCCWCFITYCTHSDAAGVAAVPVVRLMTTKLARD
jgi:hypothetical protein